MSIITVGADLAKNIFAVHGVNEADRGDILRRNKTRLKNEAHALVFPRGLSMMLNMTGCSLAVLNLLASAEYEKGKRPLYFASLPIERRVGP